MEFKTQPTSPETFGVKRRDAVTTIGIYITDKPTFAHCKSIMMNKDVEIKDADVIHDLLQTWFYLRNDAS